MTFIQIMSFHADDLDAVEELSKGWADETEGRRTIVRSTVAVDRNDPTHVMLIAEFDSYESAMENSALPETDALAQKLGEMVTKPPVFYDLDVREVEDFSS